MSEHPLSGFLNISKPAGITSHDVVAAVRRRVDQTGRAVKVGHAGTLDPMATGVLVLCIGAATRLSDYVMQGTKEYHARVALGIATDTYDREGQITAQTSAEQITLPMIEDALSGFTGEILQVPPMYSAVKKQGKKLYELARQGKIVEREARQVTIEHIEVLDWQPPQVMLRITCSPGTYIRSLAHDLGECLEVGAHLSDLMRTRSGSFRVEHAVSLDTLVNETDVVSSLIGVRSALSGWPILELSAEDIIEIAHGRAIPRRSLLDQPMVFAFGARSDELVALLRANEEQWRPQKVFIHS